MWDINGIQPQKLSRKPNQTAVTRSKPNFRHLSTRTQMATVQLLRTDSKRNWFLENLNKAYSPRKRNLKATFRHSTRYEHTNSSPLCFWSLLICHSALCKTLEMKWLNLFSMILGNLIALQTMSIWRWKSQNFDKYHCLISMSKSTNVMVWNFFIAH